MELLYLRLTYFHSFFGRIWTKNSRQIALTKNSQTNDKFSQTNSDLNKSVQVQNWWQKEVHILSEMHFKECKNIYDKKHR